MKFVEIKVFFSLILSLQCHCVAWFKWEWKWLHRWPEVKGPKWNHRSVIKTRDENLAYESLRDVKKRNRQREIDDYEMIKWCRDVNGTDCLYADGFFFNQHFFWVRRWILSCVNANKAAFKVALFFQSSIFSVLILRPVNKYKRMSHTLVNVSWIEFYISMCSHNLLKCQIKGI